MEHTLSTPQKALQINLDLKKFGTFAEIGAGQEVARWFFHVGRAAGTVAKSISAYDMAISDALYGASRALCEPRPPGGMLDPRVRPCCERHARAGAQPNALFVFADTVATQSHSIIGRPGLDGDSLPEPPAARASEIIIHVRDARPRDRSGSRRRSESSAST